MGRVRKGGGGHLRICKPAFCFVRVCIFVLACRCRGAPAVLGPQAGVGGYGVGGRPVCAVCLPRRLHPPACPGEPPWRQQLGGGRHLLAAARCTRAACIHCGSRAVGLGVGAEWRPQDRSRGAAVAALLQLRHLARPVGKPAAAPEHGLGRRHVRHPSLDGCAAGEAAHATRCLPCVCALRCLAAHPHTRIPHL